MTKIRDVEICATTRDALGTLRTCLLCGWSVRTRKAIAELPVGRGYAMRETNIARGKMIQHWHAAHAEQYDALRLKAKRD